MIRLIAVAFAVALASSAQAVPLAPLPQLEGIATEAAVGCERVEHGLVVSA
jgi:hypothetical protein